MIKRPCLTLLLSLVALDWLLGTIAVFAAVGTIDDAIVYIECTHDGATTRGSGVVVSAEGYVLTAEHVVSPKVGSKVDCKGSIGIADPNIAQRMIVQPKPALNVDVALLRFAAQKSYEFMPYCTLEDWMVRREIFVAGFPDGTDTGAPSFRQGVLSTVMNNSAGILETDGQTVRGMSGGPVVSETLGQLVGIVIGASFDALGMVAYYGILPVGRYATALGLPKSERLCYRRSREVDLSPMVSGWRAGDAAVKLGVRADEGFCFIDKVWGQFNDPGDSIGVRVVGGEYELFGENRQGGQHGASARCVWFH